MSNRIFCCKCRVSFQVGPKRGESTMCSVPGCKQIFWHVDPRSNNPSVIIVGMTPEAANALITTGEIAA